MTSLLYKGADTLLTLLEHQLLPVITPLLAKGVVPDKVIRFFIRKLLQQRLNTLQTGDITTQQQRLMSYIQQLKNMPIAIATKDANEQHYEVPAEYYRVCLGPWLKYSCCLYETTSTAATSASSSSSSKDITYLPVSALQQAEENMLRTVCQRLYIDPVTWKDMPQGVNMKNNNKQVNTAASASSASAVNNGKRLSVLDLGCGWGSFALYVAEKFPFVDVTAVSNSHSQREFIQGQAKARGLHNLVVITANVVELEFEDNVKFDRIHSTEMFEHMKNYDRLLEKVSSWLQLGGFVFIHIFVHKEFPYHFEDGWMAKNFFSGGQMPSDDLLLYFQRNLNIVQHHRVNGINYAKTCDAWLERMDKNLSMIRSVFAATYGEASVDTWVLNWRLFYMACSELFAFNDGQEWFVSHYTFQKTHD